MEFCALCYCKDAGMSKENVLSVSCKKFYFETAKNAEMSGIKVVCNKNLMVCKTFTFLSEYCSSLQTNVTMNRDIR